MEMSLSVCETGGISKEKYDILLSIFEDWAAENPHPSVVVSILKSFAKSPEPKPKTHEISTKVEEHEEREAPAVIKLEDEEEENDEFNQATNVNNNAESQSDHHDQNGEDNNNLSSVTTTEVESQDHGTQSTSSSFIHFDHETESTENNQIEVYRPFKRILRSDLQKAILSETGVVLEKKHKTSSSSSSTNLDASVSPESPQTLFRHKSRKAKKGKSPSSSSTIKRFTCSHCQSAYSQKSGLIRHQRFLCPSGLAEYNGMKTLTRRLKKEGNWW